MDHNTIETIATRTNPQAPRVTKEHIDMLANELRYEHWLVPDTTVTVVAAITQDGFLVCTATSAAVSKENFNPQSGIDIAVGKAKAAAISKLWELEGYFLKKAATNND